MPSIERIRATTLSLLGLGAVGRSGAEADRCLPEPDSIEQAEGPPAGLISPGTPVFEVVETALKDAGYLDS